MKKTNKNSIIKIQGKLDSACAIHVGTILEYAIENRISCVILDFTRVLEFEYSAMALLKEVLAFYQKDFSQITCRGLSKDTVHIFRELGVGRIPGVRIVAPDRHTEKKPTGITLFLTKILYC